MAQHEPLISAAFFEAIADIRDNAQISRIIEFLRQNDIESAIQAINLDPVAFRRVDQAILTAYEAGGIATVTSMPPIRSPELGRVVVRFDVRNPRAEQALREHSSSMITRIVDDQRTMIRTALTEGLAAGKNPRNTALDVVGRLNRATGRREGGTIGLTAPQERYVARAREELMSGDPAKLRAYLDRARRDKRFDRTVAKAIREGKPLDQATVDRIAGRYSDRLVQLRGETIARTETMQALNASQVEAWDQAIEASGLNRADIRQVWIATADRRTRDSHRHLNGEEIMLGGTFSNGLRYPGDPNAPVSEIANCRCTMITRMRRQDQ